MLPKCILLLPPFRIRKNTKFVVSIIKCHIKSWKDGAILDLWSEACNQVSDHQTTLDELGELPKMAVSERSYDILLFIELIYLLICVLCNLS